MQEAGFSNPLPLQSKVISRILGGQELICVGPEGSGKTTSLVLAVLMRLKFSFEEAPRTLILVPDKEKVQALAACFHRFGERTGIRVVGLYAGAGMEGQKEALAEGVDVVIGTPDRVLAIYLKSALNLNRLQQFILDDAEGIVKQGFQSAVHQIAASLPKCQRMIFSELWHEKLERLGKAFLLFPQLVEVETELDPKIYTIPLYVYQVPNYKTKQRLLLKLLEDKEAYRKLILFANTKLTTQNVHKALEKRFPGESALLKPMYDHQGVKTVEEFKKSAKFRVLLIANELEQFMDVGNIPHLLHLDLPLEPGLFIQHVTHTSHPTTPSVSLVFATDIELALVKKIEAATGQKMHVLPLPDDFPLEETPKRSRKETGTDEQELPKSAVSNQGAFHEKKAKNAKDYNWGWKEKNKLFGKKYKNPKHK